MKAFLIKYRFFILLLLLSIILLNISCKSRKNFDEIKEYPKVLSPSSSECLNIDTKGREIFFSFTQVDNSLGYDLFLNGKIIASTDENKPQLVEDFDKVLNRKTYTFTYKIDNILDEYVVFSRAKNVFQYMYSDVVIFGFKPPPPTLYQPVDAKDANTISAVIKAPQFQWSKIEGFVVYNLQIAEDSSFQKLIIDTLVTRTSYTPDIKPGNYYWKVATYSSNCPIENWDWSETWRFNLRCYGGIADENFYYFPSDATTKRNCPSCEAMEFYKPTPNSVGYFLLGSVAVGTHNLGVNVHVFDKDTMERKLIFDVEDLTNHNAVHLDGITYDTDGNIYITSQDTGKIYRYKPGADMSAPPEYIPIKNTSDEIIDIGPGDKDTDKTIVHKQNCYGLDWNKANGLLYLGYYHDNKIYAYKTSGGEPVYEFEIQQDISDAIPSSGLSNETSSGLGYDQTKIRPVWGIDCDSDGNVYVSTMGPQKSIQVYTAEGQFIRQIGYGIIADPIDVHIDRFGNVLVSDVALKKIIAFSKKGDFLDSWGNEEYLSMPWGLTTDDKDNVYVINNNDYGWIVKFLPSIF